MLLLFIGHPTKLRKNLQKKSFIIGRLQMSCREFAFLFLLINFARSLNFESFVPFLWMKNEQFIRRSKKQ